MKALVTGCPKRIRCIATLSMLAKPTFMIALYPNVSTAQ